MSSRKIKFKKGIFQKLFWFLSFIFIIVIFLIILIRFLSVGKKFNSDKKIYEYIIENSSLKKVDDTYYFSGENANNYLKYGNMLFRIIKIYKDGSMDIITDKSINSLYNKNDDVLKYVNDIFYKSIDHKYLKTSPYCEDIISDVKKITCDKINFSHYVKLLPLIDYVNTIDSSKTYLPSMWLGTSSKDGIWIITDDGIALGKEDSINYVYPVITLNNQVKYTNGDGTEEKPFILESSSKLGGYVKIEDDMYVIVEDNHNLKLSLVGDKILVRKTYSEKFIDDLNLDYYNDLSYKKVLQKYDINVNEYNDSYLCSGKKSVYVGLPMVSDMKLDDSIEDYYLINSGENIYYYNDGLKIGSKNLSMKLRTTVSIKENKINSGTGSYDDPYIVEVK